MLGRSAIHLTKVRNLTISMLDHWLNSLNIYQMQLWVNVQFGSQTQSSIVNKIHSASHHLFDLTIHAINFF